MLTAPNATPGPVIPQGNQPTSNLNAQNSGVNALALTQDFEDLLEFELPSVLILDGVDINHVPQPDGAAALSPNINGVGQSEVNIGGAEELLAGEGLSSRQHLTKSANDVSSPVAQVTAHETADTLRLDSVQQESGQVGAPTTAAIQGNDQKSNSNVVQQLVATPPKDSASESSFESTKSDTLRTPTPPTAPALSADAVQPAVEIPAENEDAAIASESSKSAQSPGLDLRSQDAPPDSSSVHASVPAPASSVETTTETSTPGPVRSIQAQVADHVVNSRHSITDGNATLELTLDPPELGKIKIVLTEIEDKLTAKLSVGKTATLDAIRGSLPSMVEALNDAGVSLDNLSLENYAQDERSAPDFDMQGVPVYGDGTSSPDEPVDEQDNGHLQLNILA